MYLGGSAVVYPGHLPEEHLLPGGQGADQEAHGHQKLQDHGQILQRYCQHSQVNIELYCYKLKSFYHLKVHRHSISFLS